MKKTFNGSELLVNVYMLSSFATSHNTRKSWHTHKKSSTFQIHVQVILSTETLACIYFSASVSRTIFGDNQVTKDQ